MRDALEADAISAFGGIVAVDGLLDLAGAEALAEHFLEIVAAPAFSGDALVRLQRKKNLRIICGMLRNCRPNSRKNSRCSSGASAAPMLAGKRRPGGRACEEWRIASRRAPTPAEWSDIRFAWDIVRHVKSNGVVVASDGLNPGICAGQTNRVSALQIAAARAGEGARGAACASDGFFPFPDGLEAAADAGCTAVIAPEGLLIFAMRW